MGSVNMDHIKEQVDKAIIDTLQDSAFVDVITTDKSGVSDNFKTVKIKILMPYAGSLLIQIDDKLLEQMIQNVYGNEFISDIQVGTDMLGELLNVVAGKIFELIASDVLFEISLPELIENPVIPKKAHVHHFVSPQGLGLDFYRQFDSL